MSGYYAKNPHYAPDDFSEATDRLLAAKEEAGRWFADATKSQKALLRLTLADIRPYKGSPRWDRAAAAARKLFDDSTAGARAVSEMVERDWMEIGEVREATSYAFDDLMLTATVAVIPADTLYNAETAYADYRRTLRMEGVFA